MNDCDDLHPLMRDYCRVLQDQGRTSSAAAFPRRMRPFDMWLTTVSPVSDPLAMTVMHLGWFRKWLEQDYRQDNGRSFAESSCRHTRLAVRRWYDWLVLAGHLAASPASDVLRPSKHLRRNSVSLLRSGQSKRLTLDDLTLRERHATRK